MRGRWGFAGAAPAAAPAVALLVAVLAALLAGCGSSASPAPSSDGVPQSSMSSSASATATSEFSVQPIAASEATDTTAPVATAAATPAATAPPATSSGLYLRYWSVAPIGPVNTFGNAPTVISDGKLLAVPYPSGGDSPLFAPPASRTLTKAAVASIVAEAQSDGLLGKSAALVCPHAADAPMMAGTATEHLVLTVNGSTATLTASCPYQQPAANSKPAAGTWAAFEKLKKLLADPVAWLGSGAGNLTPYDPDRLAVLAEVDDTSGERPLVADWPLAPFASFGVDFAGGRCAVVTGADEAALLPVVKAATESTAFRDDDDALADLVVRAFMPGEPDPCQGS